MTESIKNHTENIEDLVASRTSALNNLNSQLIDLASKDSLTNLVNRAQLYKEIETLIRNVKNKKRT